MVCRCLCTRMYIANTNKIMFSNSVHGILQEARQVTGFCPSRMKGYHTESRHGIGPPSQALWQFCTGGSRGVLDVRGPPCPAWAQLWCIATAAVQLQAWPPSSFSLRQSPSFPPSPPSTPCLEHLTSFHWHIYMCCNLLDFLDSLSLAIESSFISFRVTPLWDRPHLPVKTYPTSKLRMSSTLS